MQGRKKSFTLIELLVVVAIIAVLVSILLPALSSAREHAKRIVCQSHLKAIDLGFDFYAQDNDDYFPRISAGGGNNWFNKLEPSVAEQGNNYRGEIFQCPSDPRGPNSTDYGMNFYTNVWSWTPFGYVRPQKRHDVRIPSSELNWQIRSRYASLCDPVDPSKFIVVCDADNVSVWSTHQIPPDISYPIDTRHVTGANYLLLDGHVAWGEEKYIIIFGVYGRPFPTF